MAQVDQGSPATPNPRDKGHAYVRDADDQSSLSSSQEPQAGVKNIEAISQTWTKWSLIAAYVGYMVFFYPLLTHLPSSESLSRISVPAPPFIPSLDNLHNILP